MKKLLIIFYSLFLLQLLVSLYDYLTVQVKFFGVGDFLESFFMDGKRVLLPLTIVVLFVILFSVKKYKPNGKHIVPVGIIFFIE
jgi:hypothetical protein